MIIIKLVKKKALRFSEGLLYVFLNLQIQSANPPMAGNHNNKHQQRQLQQRWQLEVNCAYVFTCVHFWVNGGKIGIISVADLRSF